MRDYQRKRQNKYLLPRAVYHKTLWHIRDYYRIKELADDLIEEKTDVDCPSKNNATSDKVASIAVKRVEILKTIEDIDIALCEIPAEYRRGVWDNIQHGQPYPLDAGRATYARHKSKFIHRVAEKIGLI